jgi:hypothetical protein
MKPCVYCRQRIGAVVKDMNYTKQTRAPMTSLVTHRYPLAGYQGTLRAIARRGESGSMKVLLAPLA